MSINIEMYDPFPALVVQFSCRIVENERRTALLQVRVVQHRLLLEFLVRCNPLRLSGEYHHSTSSIHNDSFVRSQFY